MKKNILTLLIFSVVMLEHSSAFAMRHYVFEDQSPVTELGDNQPSSVPEKTDFNLVEYFSTSAVRYPATDFFDVRRTKRSQDVNSMDEVPASTWYTPRLGHRKITPQELVKGPKKVGPPQKPFKIVKAKSGGSGKGFMIEDKRGHRYLIKFDEPDLPNTESTVNVVLNRLFWALGYNVPEDYLFFFDQDDFSIEVKTPEEQDQVDIALFSAMPNDDGFYRTVASLFLDGEILGPIPVKGTRKGDPNDQIDHENLRVLRALAVFFAWTNNSGIRVDNTLDVYEGEPGRGHTVHYLLDFGEALGVHGLVKGFRWDGFEHLYSFDGITERFLTLGYPRKWERIESGKYDIQTYFEAEHFDPSSWREIVQFAPIQLSQPDDNYWAIKLISAVTREHLEALFAEAKHPEQSEVDYWIQTLLKRREILYDYHLRKVSPIEFVSLSAHQLTLEDKGKELRGSSWSSTYKVQFFNRNNQHVASNQKVSSLNVTLSSEMFEKAKGYLRVEVTTIHEGKKSSRPAEFHFRGNDPTSAKLVGVVH